MPLKLIKAPRFGSGEKDFSGEKIQLTNKGYISQFLKNNKMIKGSVNWGCLLEKRNTILLACIQSIILLPKNSKNEIGAYPESAFLLLSRIVTLLLSRITVPLSNRRVNQNQRDSSIIAVNNKALTRLVIDLRFVKCIQSAFPFIGFESSAKSTPKSMEGDTVRRRSGRVCAQIRPGRQVEPVHVDLHEIEVEHAVELESEKRKTTLSPPLQEDDDDFVDPPQRKKLDFLFTIEFIFDYVKAVSIGFNNVFFDSIIDDATTRKQRQGSSEMMMQTEALRDDPKIRITSYLLTKYNPSHLIHLYSWDLLRTHIFPRIRELPQFPISPKPLFFSKNRLRNSSKRLESLKFAEIFFEKNDIFFLIFAYVQLFFIFAYMQLFFLPFLKQNLKTCTYARMFFCIYAKFLEKKSCFFGFFFATGLVFERFLAPRSRFFEKVNSLGVLGFSNPRTPPISYISQTVIHLKTPTSRPSKTFIYITIR
ncbi:hypothetical protein LXL04_009648 [Taraxacum kok-saghyz]